MDILAGPEKRKRFARKEIPAKYEEPVLAALFLYPELGKAADEKLTSSAETSINVEAAMEA
jgi:hypothetical protein